MNVPLVIVASLVLASSAAIASPTPENRCQTGKNQAAGKYSFCLQKAMKTLLINGDMVKFNESQSKCQTKFNEAWAKLEQKAFDAGATCPTTGDATSIAALVTSCSENIALALDEAKQVFVTNQLFDGNLGGLVGADARCQAAAGAAGLGGTWKAWLSDSATLARDRIAVGRYERLDGTVVANDLDDLTDGTIDAPINVTETGVTLTGNDVRAWTGTLSNGYANYGLQCNDWTVADTTQGSHGDYTATGQTWTQYLFQNCSDANRLYCFEQ